MRQIDDNVIRQTIYISLMSKEVQETFILPSTLLLNNSVVDAVVEECRPLITTETPFGEVLQILDDVFQKYIDEMMKPKIGQLVHLLSSTVHSFDPKKRYRVESINEAENRVNLVLHGYDHVPVSGATVVHLPLDAFFSKVIPG